MITLVLECLVYTVGLKTHIYKGMIGELNKIVPKEPGTEPGMILVHNDAFITWVPFLLPGRMLIL